MMHGPINIRATVYHNISAVIESLVMEIYRAEGDWTDEINRPLLCEVEGGDVRTNHPSILVRKRSNFFSYK